MGDIKKPLELVRTRLNEFIRATEPHPGEDWVVLSNLVDHDSRAHEHCDNKIIMFLANIQHETVRSTYNRNQPAADDDGYVIVAAPLYIDLYVLFYANFHGKNYGQGLQMISLVISFFQQNPAFTNQTLPDLGTAIGKLTFEITSLNITDLNYLMGLLGAKYLPSVYYKVRMIPFQGDAMSAAVPAAKGIKAPGVPAKESHQPARSSVLAGDIDE